MGYRFFHVDAFCDRPFSGNAAAICLLRTPQEPQWMQKVAFEMNLSETAFLLKEKSAYRLRWFSPRVEVELCGHATLAAAHILWEENDEDQNNDLSFVTQSGMLTARRLHENIELNFPRVEQTPVAAPPELLSALGCRPKYVGQANEQYLLELNSEAEVRELRPDFAQLKSVSTKGVMVTSRSEGTEFDFVSRYFTPQQGIDEDPVTGSAHCALGPFWQKRLGKSSLKAHQISERGGKLIVVVHGDRVALQGRAVTIYRGELLV